jgi:hypothetical protein
MTIRACAPPMTSDLRLNAELQGAAGFYYGYFCSNCPFNLLPSILVSNWFCIVSGYILGSVCLLSASYIMILELAFMQCRTERETDASEVPLIVV